VGRDRETEGFNVIVEWICRMMEVDSGNQRLSNSPKSSELAHAFLLPCPPSVQRCVNAMSGPNYPLDRTFFMKAASQMTRALGFRVVVEFSRQIGTIDSCTSTK